MNLKELEYANDLRKKIKQIKYEDATLHTLEDRIEETTHEDQTGISIKLAEAYLCTPTVLVSLDAFKDFIKHERMRLQRQIINLEMEFEGFQTQREKDEP